MRKATCVALMLAGAAATLLAQSHVRVITRPALPRAEDLRRLSLDLQWHTQVRYASSSDGIFNLQVIPGKEGAEVLVQTLSGAVLLYGGLQVMDSYRLVSGTAISRSLAAGAIAAALAFAANAWLLSRGVCSCSHSSLRSH